MIMREDPVELLRDGPTRRAEWLAARTGTSAAAIWEWGVVERVSTLPPRRMVADVLVAVKYHDIVVACEHIMKRFRIGQLESLHCSMAKQPCELRHWWLADVMMKRNNLAAPARVSQ